MKLGRIIFADIAIAALAVVLWSPIVGLRPSDPNLLRAAAAITSYVAVPAALVAVNRPLLSLGRPGGEKLLESGRNGRELGSGSDDLVAQLKAEGARRNVSASTGSSKGHAANPLASRPNSYQEQISAKYATQNSSIMGEYAYQAARQVESATRKRHRVIDMLSSGKLTPGSLAWQRFATGIDEAETTIRANAELIASASMSFDDEDYNRLCQSISSGSYRSDSIDDELQLQRLSVYKQTLARVKDVLDNNERILLELDNFASEVSMQSMTPSDASSERMLQEMRTLIDEARQYA